MKKLFILLTFVGAGLSSLAIAQHHSGEHRDGEQGVEKRGRTEERTRGGEHQKEDERGEHKGHEHHKKAAQHKSA